ncbi:hypothetical protein CEXT_168231 [Caerostris extrusa]|uniref:Uncharacterized protein n=1 Tax=Caerostris extrusa TaxID=172846 RepID=A0AAV4Q5X7_CAEEX|nr:hypothetical protein CEXT_168231 [Caerostris extrusa]
MVILDVISYAILMLPEAISTSKENLNRVEQIEGCPEPTIRGSSMPVTVTGQVPQKFRRYPRPNGVFRANKKGGAVSGGDAL